MSGVDVLLTGATGFVGSHVARLLLARGHTVHALLRPGSSTARIEDVLPHLHPVPCALSDTDALHAHIARIRPELCLHLAWHATPGSYLHAPENIDMLRASLALAQSLAVNGCRRLLVTGTCFEYDAEVGWLHEDSPLRPLSLYAATKAALGQTLSLWPGAMQSVWPRLFYLYGPGEDPRRLVASVICALRDGQPAQTTHGGQVRDYLHVADCAAAIVALAEADATGPVNVGSGVPVTVRDMVTEIADKMGRPDLLQLGALSLRGYDPPFLCADVRRLHSVTDWRPRFALNTGLEDTMAWWQAQ